MKRLEQGFNKILNLEIMYSIIYFLGGLVLFFKSEVASNIVAVILGAFVFINGIIAIYKFIEKNKISLFKLSFIFGIVGIILGILIMLNPGKTIDFLNLGFGLWLITEGISKVLLFLNLKNIKDNSSKIVITTAILLIGMGIIILINAFNTILIAKTIGAFVMLYNVLALNDLVLIKRRSKNIIKMLK